MLRGIVLLWAALTAGGFAAAADVRDPVCRPALVANLSSHPESDPVLFSEKYLPKDPAEAASTATGLPPITAAR